MGLLRRTRSGYHRAVAGLATAGNDVIMDYPLSEPWRLEDLVAVLDGVDVTTVEVWCEPEELERRESARTDRPTGLAAAQTSVYHHGYDLRVDTTTQGPDVCARSLVEQLTVLPRPKLFDHLRARS